MRFLFYDTIVLCDTNKKKILNKICYLRQQQKKKKWKNKTGFQISCKKYQVAMKEIVNGVVNECVKGKRSRARNLCQIDTLIKISDCQEMKNKILA